MSTDFLFWNTKSKQCMHTDNRHPLFHSDTTSLGQGLESFDCAVCEKGKKKRGGGGGSTRKIPAGAINTLFSYVVILNPPIIQSVIKIKWTFPTCNNWCTLGLPENRLVHSTPMYNVVCGAVFTDCSFIQLQNLENIHFFL